MILSCTFLIQHSSVSDRQTDGWTDAQVIAKTRETFCCHAQKVNKFHLSGSVVSNTCLIWSRITNTAVSECKVRFRACVQARL